MDAFSDWHRWDLHIHTPETQMNNCYEDENGSKEFPEQVWKRYCQNLNDYGADVLGITDYFSADNFFKLKANRNRWNLDSNIVLFPNIELRVTDLVSKKKVEKGKTSSFTNIHIIFDPNVSKNEIHKFLSALTITRADGSSSNYADDLKTMVHGNVVDSMPTTDTVISALKSVYGNNFREHVFIMIPNSGDGIYLGDGNGVKHSKDFVLQNVSFLQARQAHAWEDQQYALNLNPKNPNAYGRAFAAVTGCDAHSVEKITSFPKSSYTWIKAEMTFEGLKQITYEPETRVRIQEQKPEPSVKSKIIQSIKINRAKSNSTELRFSDGLNTIIGGRSSGKSILLSVLAKLASGQKKFKSNNARYDQLVQDLSKECELHFADGRIATGSDQIEFIYQDGLQEIARDHKRQTEFIEHTLKSSTPQVTQARAELDTYKDNVLRNISENVNALRTLDRNIQDDQESLQQNQSSEIIERNLHELRAKITNLRGTVPEIDKSKLEKIIQQIQSLTSSIATATKDLEWLTKLRGIPLVRTNLEVSTPLENQSQLFVSLTDKEIEKLNKSLSTLLESYIIKVSDDKKGYEKDLIKLKDSTVYKQHLEFQKSSPMLTELQESFQNQQNLLITVKAIKDELNGLVLKRKDLIASLKQEFDFRGELSPVEVFDANHLNVNFGSVVQGKDFAQICDQIFKQSSVAFKKKILNASSDEPEITLDSPEKLTADQILQVIWRTIDYEPSNDETNPFRAGMDLYKFLEAVASLSFIHPNYSIKYINQDFSDMSEGKQAFILLMMQLSFDEDDKPLLIDQPEDELDNKAIYDDLVKYLREQKKHRQLFVVTHNANVVVGGDSECITLADETIDSTIPNRYRYDYTQGTIENPEMQNNICEVLEGGEKAFKQRESRYSFSRVI